MVAKRATRGPGGGGSITVHRAAVSTVVVLDGDIDAGLRPDAGAALAELVRHDAPVVLDASGVRAVDAAGAAFLVQCAQHGKEQGVAVHLADAPPTVVRALQAAGALSLFS